MSLIFASLAPAALRPRRQPAAAPPAFEKVSARRSAPGTLGDRGVDRGAQPLGVESLVVEAHAGVGALDPSGDFELVAAERNHANRYACGERLLGDALAAVGDHAGSASEDRGVGHEALDPRVGGAGRTSAGSYARGRGDDGEVVGGESLEGGGDELVVALAHRGGGDQDDRPASLRRAIRDGAGGSHCGRTDERTEAGQSLRGYS